MIHLLTVEEKEAIKKYNNASRLNNFLYKDKESNTLFEDIFYNEHGNTADRFQLVDICNNISRKLTPGMHRFHRKKCIIGDREGVIKHELKREYNGKVIDNETSFLAIDHDSDHLDTIIALWVDTGDKFTSHLYTIDKIKIID